MSSRILVGDCRELLAGLPSGSVQSVVTSPPYFGLRDYGTGEWEGGDSSCEHYQGRHGSGRADGIVDARGQRNRDGVAALTSGVCSGCGAVRVDRQVGLEPSPDEYVTTMVSVFREVRRVLRDDGTVWLNLGDSYNAAGRVGHGTRVGFKQGTNRASAAGEDAPRASAPDLKEKDLLMIPAMVALALRADGWYLRSEIVWSKPNPMPESMRDRPTQSHEKLFLFTKQPRYFYDADAIREPQSPASLADHLHREPSERASGAAPDRGDGDKGLMNGVMVSGWRNRRNVWTVATQPYAEAHFATFPTKLIEPCVLAGTSPKACGQCGAPWRRVMERGESAYARLKREGATWQEMEAVAAAEGKNRKGGGVASVGGTRKPNGVIAQLDAGPAAHAGWEPTCSHDDDSARCVVLDPFAGSGTVGVVSSWYGRDFIGLELNPGYAVMAEQRIATDGYLGRSAYRPEPPDDDQLALL